MTLSELARAVGAYELCGDGGVRIDSLCADSRAAAPGALFFAIVGLNQDAHRYAPDAVRRGAVAAVVSKRLELPCPQLIVGDVRKALSLMAAAFYGEPAKSLRMIGITGTKGKTTTAFLAKSILEAAGYKVGLIGTVGSKIGDRDLPQTLTTPDPIDFQRLLREMADEGVEFVVMEVSANALAFKRLAGARFEAAGFTNLSHDHLDLFGTMERYLEVKLGLFEGGMSDFAAYNADDERVSEAMARLPIDMAAYGIRVLADYNAKEIEIEGPGCSFALHRAGRPPLPIRMRLAGVFNLYNAMLAAALCARVGAGDPAIRAGLEAVASVPGRFEFLEVSAPYAVILDYAHSPDSLETILATVRQSAKRRVIALFGCGGGRDYEKRPIMGEIGGRLSDYTILTSDNPRNEDPFEILSQIEEGIVGTGKPYIVIENRREAIRHALSIAGPGDAVVLAGKGHETVQDVRGAKLPFDERAVVAELMAEMKSSRGGGEA